MTKAELEKSVQKRLFEMQDLKYRDFHSNLMPNIDKERVIGVRTPLVRSFAKEFAKTPDAWMYMEILPHKFYEENNLHAFLIEQIKDYDKCIDSIDKFLPFVDNWATCDSMKPKVFAKNPEKIRKQASIWMESEQTYTIRYGIEILLNHFLDERFDVRDLQEVSSIRSEEYYVNMMIAWYFATALSKQYEATLPFIEKQNLDVWTHNKAIQKAIESRLISKENKEYLRSLKVK